MVDIGEDTFAVVAYPYNIAGGNWYSNWSANYRRNLAISRFRQETIDERAQLGAVKEIDYAECLKELYGAPYRPGQ